jgi:hypothetical protein
MLRHSKQFILEVYSLLSTNALHKYMQAVSGHENRRCFEIDIMHVCTSLRRAFYSVLGPVETNGEFVPL